MPQITVPTTLQKIAQKIQEVGGTVYYVGGCVRDNLLNMPIKDFDIEVHWLSIDELQDVLLEFGETELVGKRFGVIKIKCDGQDYDFSVPRKESKVGVSHTDFLVEFGNMSLGEACSRRDFTINSMMQEVLTGKVIDIFGGKQDLSNNILRHTTEKFQEDALRIMRGAQFCSRFNLNAHPSTIEMCKNMSLDDVSPERMNAEYLKLLKGDNPSKGLRFLKECGHLPKCLENLVGCPQDPRWHPEGDAFEHTLCVMDAMKDILQREKIDGERYIVLMLSAMLHDVGKANTTVITKEKISSKGHAITGVPIARDFMNSIFVNHKVIEQVIPLVKEHMSHCNKFGDKAVRKLSVRMEPSNISNLCILMEADCSGRPPIPRGKNENILIIEESAKRQGLMFGSITPFIQGKDLIELGLKPGPNFSNIISDMKERQISGEIQSKEQAMKFVRKVHA